MYVHFIYYTKSHRIKRHFVIMSLLLIFLFITIIKIPMLYA